MSVTNNTDLKHKLLKERAELCRMVSEGKSLSDGDVYKKSCLLDKLIVNYMKAREA